MATIELRDYQRDAVDEVHRHWSAGRGKVILSLPTGGGKTETALAIMNEKNTMGLRCLVIVDRVVLCDQWIARMHRNGITDTGILQGSRTSRTSVAHIVVATAQTIASRSIESDYGLIVIDECHYWHTSHQAILKNLSSETKVLGLSATPFNADMLKSFDSIVAPVSASSLIETGNLVSSRVFIPRGGDRVKRKLKAVPIRNGDFKTCDLDEAMRTIEIMGDVVSEWVRLGENRPTIAFCVSVLHAKALASQFVEQGIPSAAITQEDSGAQRDYLIAEFEAGNIKVLTSVNVLAVGFDSPMASCAIFARPTLSRGLHIQMAGRVIRLFNNKSDAVMLDHAGNIERHGRIENFSVPQTMAELIKKTEKGSREDCFQGADVTCESCGLVYPRLQPFCPECAHRRTKKVLTVIEGELQELTIGELDVVAGTDPSEINRLYTKALRYAKWMGFKPAWAYHKTIERFALKGDPYSKELDQLIRPRGQHDRSWVTTSLDQDDLDWLQTASTNEFKISLDQINCHIQPFQIDTGSCLGWQAFSINRMRLDANHALKAIICCALAAKHTYRKVTYARMSLKINGATKGKIKDIEALSRHVKRVGACDIYNGSLTIRESSLPFSRAARERVMASLGNSTGNRLEIPCMKESIFAGAI